MRVKIIVNSTEYILGMVQLVNMEMYRQGGVEKKYGKQASGQPDNRHRIGMKRARFAIRRMFKTDVQSQHDLLYDLHNNDTEFKLVEYVPEATTPPISLILEECISYKYNAITGVANDIVGEEIIGEGTYWSSEAEEPDFEGAGCEYYFENWSEDQHFVNGGFETGDLTGWVVEAGDPDVDAAFKHWGNFGVRASATDGDNMSQSWDPPIPLSTVKHLVFWTENIVGVPVSRVTITYDDDTTFQKNYGIGSPDWIETDVLPDLNTNKSIKKINFEPFGGIGNPRLMKVDDFSMEKDIEGYWDFSDANWELNNAIFVSAPTSLHFTGTGGTGTLIKTSTIPIANGKQGRIITYIRRNVDIPTEFVFRYQDDDNYYCYMPRSHHTFTDKIYCRKNGNNRLLYEKQIDWGLGINTWKKIRVTWWNGYIGLNIKAEYWSGSEWITIIECTDNENNWRDIGGRIGLGDFGINIVSGSYYYDDTEIYGCG